MWEWFTTKPWIDRGEARFVSPASMRYVQSALPVYPSNASSSDRVGANAMAVLDDRGAPVAGALRPRRAARVPRHADDVRPGFRLTWETEPRKRRVHQAAVWIPGDRHQGA